MWKNCFLLSGKSNARSSLSLSPPPLPSSLLSVGPPPPPPYTQDIRLSRHTSRRLIPAVLTVTPHGPLPSLSALTRELLIRNKRHPRLRPAFACREVGPPPSHHPLCAVITLSPQGAHLSCCRRHRLACSWRHLLRVAPHLLCLITAPSSPRERIQLRRTAFAYGDSESQQPNLCTTKYFIFNFLFHQAQTEQQAEHSELSRVCHPAPALVSSSPSFLLDCASPFSSLPSFLPAFFLFCSIFLLLLEYLGQILDNMSFNPPILHSI